MSGKFDFSSGTGSSLQFELGNADLEDWIPTTIKFATPSFSGVTGASIRWGDFDMLANDLEGSCARLPSSLTFENEEQNIDLTIRLNSIGNGKVSAIIRAAGGDVLLDLETDQAAVRSAAADLRHALANTGRGHPF